MGEAGGKVKFLCKNSDHDNSNLCFVAKTPCVQTPEAGPAAATPGAVSSLLLQLLGLSGLGLWLWGLWGSVACSHPLTFKRPLGHRAPLRVASLGRGAGCVPGCCALYSAFSRAPVRIGPPDSGRNLVGLSQPWASSPSDRGLAGPMRVRKQSSGCLFFGFCFF